MRAGQRPSAWRLGVAGLVAAAIPMVALAQTTLPTRTSSERGVTIQVTPRPPGPGTGTWEFRVALDTHSAELNDDLAQSASLSTGDGRIFKPLRWTGAGPGGHHREGVLAFDVPAPPPAVLELRIERKGEAGPRTFRWQR